MTPLWPPTVSERLRGQLSVARRLGYTSAQLAVLLALLRRGLIGALLLLAPTMSGQPVEAGAGGLAFSGLWQRLDDGVEPKPVSIPIPAVETPAVSYACSPNSREIGRAVFQTKRTWRTVTVWDCSVRNESAVSLAISEGVMIRAMIQAGTLPISSAHMRTFAAESMRRGPLMTAIRILSLAAQGLAVASAGNFGVQVDPTTGAVFAGLAAGFPVLGRALGERAPSQDLFERLAWRDSVGLEPGQTATVTMFSQTTTGMVPIRGGL